MKIFLAFLAFVTSVAATPVPRIEEEFRSPWETLEFGVTYQNREQGKTSESLFILRKNNRLTFYKTTTDQYGKVQFSSGHHLTNEGFFNIEKEILNIWHSKTSSQPHNETSRTWLLIRFHSNGLYNTSTKDYNNPTSLNDFTEWMRTL